MTTRTHATTTRLTDAEWDILQAVIGTMDAPGREPASESEAIRMLLRQWAADNNYRPEVSHSKNTP